MVESPGSGVGGVESGFRRYPKYRDSGVEWLGEIPAHWEVRRLKCIATINDEVLPETTDPSLRVSYVEIGNVDSARGILGTHETVFGDAPSQARRIVREQDVIVSTVRTYLKAVAQIGPRHSGVIASTGFAVIRPGSMWEKRFAGFALQAPYFIEQVIADSAGVAYPAITPSDLCSLAVVVPPCSEQYTIADFLDRETEVIDGLVRKKERMVELLREKRAFVISRAVTKGLDPEVPMKETGIEWLGEIPAHWGIRRLKDFTEMQSGESITAASIETDGPYPVFGGNGLRGYGSDFTHEGVHVLVGRQGAHCGNVHTVNGRFWASEHAVVVRSGWPNVIEWLGALLEAMDLNQHSGAAAQPGLAVDRLRNLRVPVPPVDEQQAIADVVDRETDQIDLLAAKVTKAIEHLSDYRTALISAAVTGRIDVWQGSL